MGVILYLDIFISTRSPYKQHCVHVEGNMEKISNTILINISRKLNFFENVSISEDFSPEEIQTYTSLFKNNCDIFYWTYEEIPGIDVKIVKHDIKMYTNTNIIR